MTHAASSLVRSVEPTRELLQGPGHSAEVGSSRVDYLWFDGLDDTDSAPVLVIGGAFQTFWSFRHEVECLRRWGPVILMNLPGQGSNLEPSAGMGFADFAELTREFLDHHGIERVTPLGLSYGSGIAHRIATLHPERTERLILGGTAPRLPASLLEILRAARHVDEQGDHAGWAWACVLHLLNLEARDETGVQDDLLDRFHASLMKLPMGAHDRWWTNSSRLFTEALTGTPRCRTLVFGCARDHFLPPFLAAEVARGCTDVEFGVIEGGDHLCMLEHPERVLTLYEAFLDDAPLDGFEWFHHGEEGFAACEDRRVCARADVRDVQMTLEDAEGRRSRVRVRNLGHHGAGITWDGPHDPPSGPAPFRLRMDDGAESLAVSCPGAAGSRVRFLFTDPVRRARWMATVERHMGMS